MNEHDESEIAARLIISATTELDAVSRSKKLRLVGEANETVRPMTLPAVSALRYFLPHAREKESFDSQRRRPFSSQLTVKNTSPGPVGRLDHPTCCLHISGPCWSRHIYTTGYTTRNNVGWIAGDGDGDVSALRVRNRNCAHALSPASSRASIQKEQSYDRGPTRNEAGR